MSAPRAYDRAWLVVVDMQRIFADPSSPWATPGYARAAAGVQRLLPAFGDRVVYTRFVAPVEPTGAWVDYYRDWPFAQVPETDPLYAITPEFVVAGPVVTMTTFGKWGAELAAVVGPDPHLVLTGVSTDCCVLSTALAAADAGGAVSVVADACAGLSPADHRRALDAMALYGPLIEITDTEQVLVALRAA